MPFSHMYIKFVILCLFSFSFSLNADIVKWVDENGQTHYSNKAPKKVKKTSKKLKFVTYKKPDKATEITFSPAEVKEDSDLDKPENSQKKLVKPLKLTISELKVLCELAREKRLAPVRKEEIENCIEDKKDHMKRPEEYCERYNRNFGNGERSGYGAGLRLFHNIPECRRLYRAEDKRSKSQRGYGD